MEDDNSSLDELIMDSSTDRENSKYQNELVFAKFLPYADDIDAEARACLIEIKANLGRAVMLREIIPGCALWSERLQTYVETYGLRFSKEDHIIFIKLMYELITIPDLSPGLITHFGTTLQALLRKKYLLSPKELELPWRPLFETYYRLKYKGDRNILYRYHSYDRRCLWSVVSLAKVYFPPNATQEILDELRPSLCPFDSLAMKWAMGSLELFLPVELLPEHHASGYHLWLEELMGLWERCSNSPEWENRIMWLMARLAYNNIGYINWEPYLPLMFTRFLRSLKLPVCYERKPRKNQHRLEVASMVLWIIGVLGKDFNTQMYFDRFLKSVETFYHSANDGVWTGKLRELLKMPRIFISRLHNERYRKPTWVAPIPEKFKLSDSDVDAFVKSMIPIAMTAMFSKTLIDDACDALRYLATIRPNLVIPVVLERMYSTQDTLTEPHKYTAAMLSVIAIARPMVQGSRNINKGYTYSEGPMHVIPLLFSSLPGIDPNDPIKTFVTFRFLSFYSMLIPIINCSRCNETMDEDDRLICESTSRFEDFVLKLLDRVFALIDSSSLEFERLENSEESEKSKLQSMAESKLEQICVNVFSQTSDEIFNCALHKLRSFITERILETRVAGKLAAILCIAFAKVNGRSTLRSLLPVLSDRILYIIAENEDIVKEEVLDTRLLYAMLMLSAVLNTEGHNLIPYIDTLQKVLDRVLCFKSKEGINIACHLLVNVLHNLSNLTPYKFTSYGRDYNDSEYPYIKDWGQAPCIKSLKIEWYVPGEQEIDITQQLFLRYLTPELDKLRKYCEDPGSLTRGELANSLKIVYILLNSCELLLPAWDEPALITVETRCPLTPFTPTLGIKGKLVMPDGSNVKSYMANFLYRLQKVILENNEDSRSLITLTSIWSTLLMGRLQRFTAYEMQRKHLEAARGQWEDKLTKRQKSYMGWSIKSVANITHEQRAQRQILPFTKTHESILLQIFQLATSRYADVRAKAQDVLYNTYKHFPSYHVLLVPYIVEILQKDTEVHHDAYKGVLYILLGSLKCPLVGRHNWQTLKSLWPAIVLAKTSEKPSVIDLRENIVRCVNTYFLTMPIKLQVPESCVAVASKLWESGSSLIVPQPTHGDIESGKHELENLNQSNLKAYTEMIDELQDALLNENLTWRHKLMAMNFINCLVHPEQVYPVRVVQYFLSALIHDFLPDRKIAVKTVAYIFQQHKKKHPKITVDVSAISQKFTTRKNQLQSLGVTDRTDNLWLQYDYDTRPLTSEQWDEPRYLHQSYIGYYAWPKKLEIYAPSKEQPTLDPEVRKLSSTEAEIDVFFSNPANINKLIDLFNLREKKRTLLVGGFDTSRFLFFKGLFSNHGDVYLQHFWPHLRKLVADQQENSLTLAAEITAGIIRGSKHWPFDMTQKMWDNLLPIVRTALSNLTVEAVRDWCECFKFALIHRDPNRHHWLFECLMDNSEISLSKASFVECIRLTVLHRVLSLQSWRVSQLLERLLSQVEDRLLSNPLSNVRDSLGLCLAGVFSADLRSFNNSSTRLTERVRKFMDKVLPKLQQLADDVATMTNTEEQNLSTQIAHISLQDSEIKSEMNPEQRLEAINILKCICSWISESIACSQYGTLPEFYEIFPIICQLKNYDVDKELAEKCVTTISMLAHALTLPYDVPVVLNAVMKISRNPSWWTRLTCLEFLQVLVFHNMSIFLSNPDWVQTVQDVVLRLLDDERVEVRVKAADVLSGLLHCAFIPAQEILLEGFKEKAKTKVHRARGNHGSDNSTDVQAIRARHAAVLGMCAFIQAHPYDIPKYIPPIFEHLRYNLGDPHPIPTTIRITLANFKRTHYDGWSGVNGHAQQFTEDQLVIVQDLSVPPSHYA